jgi:hypothetical protein
MNEENISDQERRKFVRLDLTEDVRALDTDGRDIGRVEKVGAGGMQIRLTNGHAPFQPGQQMEIKIVEPGDVQQQFKVEVRVCHGDIMGVQFLN